MHIILETERLSLRRFTSADGDRLVDLDSDPEVMRFLNGGEPTPRSVVREQILRKSWTSTKGTSTSAPGRRWGDPAAPSSDGSGFDHRTAAREMWSRSAIG
jgi:RimJ/RimL family protein N-acetyltransferase